MNWRENNVYKVYLYFDKYHPPPPSQKSNISDNYIEITLIYQQNIIFILKMIVKMSPADSTEDRTQVSKFVTVISL